jgi:hypothetical protein
METAHSRLSLGRLLLTGAAGGLGRVLLMVTYLPQVSLWLPRQLGL